jgi:COMPASS component BRE2
MEFNVVRSNDDSKAHVRVGLARKEASLEAPVGFDGYSYGLRDVTGQKLNLSRPKHFMDTGFKSGDTIGMLIELPLLDQHKLYLEQFDAQQKKHIPQKGDDAYKEKKRKKSKAKVSNPETAVEMNTFGNIVRDQIPIKYKNSLYYEQFEYTTNKAMDHLLNPVTVFGEKAILESINNMQAQIPTIPDSKIVVFKNGEKVGVMFENLYSFLPTFNEDEAASIFPNAIQLQNSNYNYTDDGTLGYYPMLSVFQGGIVGLNPGPEFKYPISEAHKPLSDRYEDRIVEEMVWDIIDEVEAEYLDKFE